MKPSQLSQLLAHTIAARLPVLIVGGPGVGKTSIVKQAAEQAGNKLVISHPAVADPTDAKGFPWVEKGKASFIPFGDLRQVIESKDPVTWFMDDLGQAPPAVQASYMPWILERCCAGNALPDHVTVIAATNRRTDRAGVAGVLEPVKSRFTAIVELEPDLDEWCQWALQQSFIPPELVAFLRFKRGDGLLYKFEPSADLKNCPLPRTWEAAGRIVQLKMPAAIEHASLVGAVGEGAAAEFVGFLEMYRQLPNIDGILMDPEHAAIPEKTSVLYAVATALASKATDKNIGRVGRYAERLAENHLGEFAALLMRDACRRSPEIQQTPAFTRLMSGELGTLISGG